MSTIKVEDIAHVRFQAPDLDRMASFLQDFGLSTSIAADGVLYGRGTGGAPFVHATRKGDPGFRGLPFVHRTSPSWKDSHAQKTRRSNRSTRPVAASSSG